MEQPKNQTVKERLKSFIEYKQMSVRAFESACGLSYGFVGNMRNSMQPDKIMKIVHCFPELNPGWVMTGEGEMLRGSSTNIGEISGNDNAIGMTVNQNIRNNNGQNAGRDIHNNPCLYGDAHFMAELAAQRQLAERQLDVYSASIDRKDEQIRVAQAQIETLIKQNQEQFNRFMSLLEAMQRQ